MKKFQFSLSKMRNYKEQILDEEKNILANLNYIVTQIEEKIASLEQSFEEISAEMLAGQEEGMLASELRTYDIQLTSIRHQLEQLRRELIKAQKDVDAQMDVVLEASQEVSKLDKLEEKQLEEYKKDVAKAEELFIDELISSDSIRKVSS